MTKAIELDARAIGQRIRKARRARRWSQKRLAREIGFKANAVATYESGWRIPEIRTLVLLSMHLRRSLDHLVLGVPRRGALWRKRS